LCDPAQTLIAAIGLKKTPKGTQRGVFVVDKSGKVLAAEPGSPAGTVDVVRALVEASGAGEQKKEDESEEANGAEAEGKKDEKEEANGKDEKNDKDDDKAE